MGSIRRSFFLPAIRLLMIGVLISAVSGCNWVKSWFAGKDEKVVNLYIWGLYTTPEMLAQFKEKTGITVVESNYGSNEELLAKLQAGAEGYDLVVPSDYMVTVLNKLGLIRELDHTKIPNLKNVDPSFLGRSYDQTNKVSLPYAWSITGIALNRALYQQPVSGWSDLLKSESLNGRFSMLDDVREAMAAALKVNGASVNATDVPTIEKAHTTLSDAKKRIKAFNSTPGNLLASGDVVAAQMYSGEVQLLRQETGKPIEFVVPVEGTVMSIDNMVIPRGAKHVEAAYKLMNFFYELKVHADFVARTGSGPILKGVKELLPVDLQNSPMLFPDSAVMQRCEMLGEVGDVMAEYDRYWTTLKSI